MRLLRELTVPKAGEIIAREFRGVGVMDVVIAGTEVDCGCEKSSLLPPMTNATESLSSSLADDSSRSRRNLLTSVRKPLTSDQAIQSNAFNLTNKVLNNISTQRQLK